MKFPNVAWDVLGAKKNIIGTNTVVNSTMLHSVVFYSSVLDEILFTRSKQILRDDT